MTDSWSLVHAERAALVEDLRGLRPEQWELPSLCAGWSVHDVAAHLVDNALTTRLGFVRGLVRARLDFHRLNETGIRRHRGATPAETLQRLEAAVPRTSGPPGPVDGRLVEEVVHGEDVRRPLGLHRDHSVESLERALRAQASTPAGFGGCKELVQRVQLVADDADVTVGSGPRASGRLVDVLLAACGRADGAQRLSGEGAALVLEAATPRERG